MKEKKKMLKRAIIKEELYILCDKDHIAAAALNQFLYWSERTRDYDKFIEEESTRDPDNKTDLTHGWIYKSASELADELMIYTVETLRKRVKWLSDKGYLDTRKNPKYGWDKTLQYRPNIHRIQRNLIDLGYVLDGYKLQLFITIPQSVECIPQSVEAIPENTTENTSENKDTPSADIQGDKTMPEEFDQDLVPYLQAQGLSTTDPSTADIHKAGIMRAIQKSAERNAGAPERIEGIPDDVHDLIAMFVEEFARKFTPKEKSFWISAARNWLELGVTPSDVKDMFRHCREKGTTIKSPESITWAWDELRQKSSGEQVSQQKFANTY